TVPGRSPVEASLPGRRASKCQREGGSHGSEGRGAGQAVRGEGSVGDRSRRDVERRALAEDDVRGKVDGRGRGAPRGHESRGHHTDHQDRLDRQSVPNFTMDMLNAMNAQHAKDHANCTKAETVALHKKNAEAADAVGPALSEIEMGKTGTVLAGMPSMSVEQIVSGILINHID